MKIGRIDLAHSLKQYFELAGQMHPELGEGIVPTAQIVDLQGTPFSLDLPFVGSVFQAGVAAEYSYAIIRPTGLPVNSWATIDSITTQCAAANTLVLEPYALASVPALTAGGTVQAMRRARIDAGAPGLPEVDFLLGTSVTAPTTLGWRVTDSAGDSRINDGPWHLGAGGALVVASTVANVTISVSVRGRVHFTSAK